MAAEVRLTALPVLVTGTLNAVPTVGERRVRDHHRQSPHRIVSGSRAGQVTPLFADRRRPPRPLGAELSEGPAIGRTDLLPGGRPQARGPRSDRRPPRSPPTPDAADPAGLISLRLDRRFGRQRRGDPRAGSSPNQPAAARAATDLLAVTGRLPRPVTRPIALQELAQEMTGRHSAEVGRLCPAPVASGRPHPVPTVRRGTALGPPTPDRDPIRGRASRPPPCDLRPIGRRRVSVWTPSGRRRPDRVSPGRRAGRRPNRVCGVTYPPTRGRRALHRTT